jgi:RHS repeat-associated protein
VDYLTSSVWRERAVDPTGLYWLGDRYYDPISSQWLSHDHSWNNRDPNGQSYCGGDPVQGTDPKGKCVQNPPPALYFGTAPVMQQYVETTTYFQNGTSATTGLPGQSEQMYDPAQVTGNSYNLVTMPTGWDFSYVSEHPLPANYGQTTAVPITQADVAMQQGDQYLKATAFGFAMLATDTEELAPEALAAREEGFGLATTSNYRKIFLDAHPELKGRVVVHHGVEQQALKLYPFEVSPQELNSLANLRGIPNNINSELHLSKIRAEWDEFYLENPFATQEQLLQQRAVIDAKYGHLFLPPVK